MDGYQNSGREVVHLLVFLAACAFVARALPALVGALPGVGRLRLGAYLRSLTAYPALTVLTALAALAGTGWVGNDFGLKNWLYPDQDVARFCAAALLVLLYGEVLLLAYLRDQEAYPLERAYRARERTATAVTRAWETLRVWPGLWRRLAAAGGGPDDPRGADLGLAYVAGPDGEPLAGEALTAALADRARRLRGAPAVVLTHGLRALPAIALITLVVVLLDNAPYLGQPGTWGRIVPHYLTYVLGLPVGWALSVVAAYALAFDLPERLGRWAPAEGSTPQGLLGGVSPPGRGIVLAGVAALAYLGGVLLAPGWQGLWLSLLAIALVLPLLRGTPHGRPEAGEPAWRSAWRQLAFDPTAAADPRVLAAALGRAAPDLATWWVYPAGVAAIGAVTSLAVLAVRLVGDARGAGAAAAGALAEELAWFAGLVLGLVLTARYLRRTRLERPGSLVAIPALLLHGFLVVCTLYRLTTVLPAGSIISWPFHGVVALPLTCLFGAAFALYFFIATLLPERAAAGVFVCLALFAYMDGTAIDLSSSELKLRYADLAAYNERPVRLDSRDYFLSSFGVVVPLDRQFDRGEAPRSLRIGGGMFLVEGPDLLVCLPDGYLPGELLQRRASYRVVVRMPRKVKIAKAEGKAEYTIARGAADTDAGVAWENLQNGALLWTIPPERPGVDPSLQGRDGRYAVFPLRPAWQKPPPQDQVPYWVYDDAPATTGPGDGAGAPPTWTITPPLNAMTNGVLPDHLYLLGNWAFPVSGDAPGDVAPPPDAYRWYRLKGAAADGFYPDFWRPGGSTARRPDEHCLNLVRPRVGQVALLDDLELTVGSPRPWGTYRVLAGGGAAGGPAWLLAAGANRWVMPEPGDRLRLDDAPGINPQAIYRVAEVQPVPPGRSVRPLAGASDLVELREPPRGTGSAGAEAGPADPDRKVAALMRIVREDADGAGGAAPPPAPAGDAVEEALARPGAAWRMVPDDEARLLDQLEVLRRWRQRLDDMRRRAGRAAAGDGWAELACACPVVHDAACGLAMTPPVACDCPVKHKLVLVTVSGGGIRSSLWAMTVLGYLERQLGPSFPYHVRIITGASGGMVGATYYTGTLQPPGTGRAHSVPPQAMADDLGRSDFLSAAASHMVFSDVPRLVTSPFSLGSDRGMALEDAWRRMSPEADRAFGATFEQLGRGELDGWRPSLVYTPMIVEDGRRLLISNLDFSFAPRNIGAMLLEPGSSLLRPQVGQFKTLLPSNIEPGFDLYSLTAIEFFRIFPAARGFRAGTAARMSATFPLISPAVTLPTLPARSVVDAGYYDNFGINLVSLWVGLNQLRDWLVENTSGVVIVQIRDHASQVLRTELDFDRRQGTGGLLSALGSRPGLATLTGDLLGAVHSRGLLQVSRPLNGLLNSRYSVTSFRNDEQIEDLSNYLRAVPPTTQDLRRQVAELAAQADWEAARADPRAAAEALAAKVHREDRRFPYTTVVFECPVDAALSWDLTDFEAENIRKGMGPEPAPDDTVVRRPLELLGSNPLDESGRRDLLQMIREEYTSKKRHGPLAGAPLTLVVDGVWHNLQRLWLLQEWWKTARPTGAVP